MSNIKVSIIVPIYNVEKYIEKCIKSLINQSLKEIEIILINDCSPDNSEKIILEYQKIDTRIIYIKQEKNQGQGAARNAGIKKAKGEYILFVDSDDYIHHSAAKILYNKANSLNLDILETNYHKVYSDKIIKIKLKTFEDVLSGDEYFNRIPFTVGVIWNKLWKTDFLIKNKLFFIDGYFEDVLYISQSISFAKRVNRIDYFFYYYIIRDNSTMTSIINEKHLKSQIDLIKSLEKVFNKSLNLKSRDQHLKVILYALSSLARFIKGFQPVNNNDYLKKEAKKFLNLKHSTFKKHIFSCSKLGFIHKILFYISPYLMNFILQKLRKCI